MSDNLTTPEPVDAQRPPALARLVAGVALTGLVSVFAVLAVVGVGAEVATVVAVPLPLLVVVLVGVTLAAELTSVRLGQGDAAEELTLVDAAVLVVVLLLPAGWALGVVLLALLSALLLRRQPLVKIVFNVGNYAVASALLVGTVHLLSPVPGVGLRSVAALLVGSLAFAAANLVGLALVLHRVTGDTVRGIVSEGARLSSFMAVSTVALGTVAVSLAENNPQLLPFTALPAAALTYAYRSSAQQTRQRARSGRLLDLSHVLAGRHTADDLAEQFLRLCREAFGADQAWVVLAPVDGEAAPRVIAVTAAGAQRRAPTTAERSLLTSLTPGGAQAGTGRLPGWDSLVLAPLDAEDRRLGVIALAGSVGVLDPDTAGLLTPLASALGAALRAAGHLHALVEQTAKLSAVVDHSSDGIFVLDGAGRVQLWSPAMASVTGREPVWVLGQRLSDVLATSDGLGAPVDSHAVGAGLLTPAAPRREVELVVTRPDGDERWLRCAHAGVFDTSGSLVQAVVIVHDSTRAHQLERLKSDFIATVSHELRTPVTPIKGYADLLRRRGSMMTKEKQQECLDIIVDRSAHLARLVEDLLLVSRITESASPAREVSVVPVDLGPLVTRAAGDFAGAGSVPGTAERLTITVPASPVPVHCDPVRVVQVVGNLVGNAIKYSSDASPVRVTVSTTPDGGHVLVSVTDAGRGIPSDQLEQVFEKFHRVEDALRMTTGGTGLGLFIARELTQAMGGTLGVSSVLGEGSTFTLTLRAATAAELAAAGPADAPVRHVGRHGGRPGGPSGLPGLPPPRDALGGSDHDCGPGSAAAVQGAPAPQSGVTTGAAEGPSRGRPPFAGPPRRQI